MIKTAAPPDSEAESNAKKSETDRMASELVPINKKKFKEWMGEMADALGQMKNPKIVVTGGAGSGKSSLASVLSDELGIKHFDLDAYVEGGFTDHKKTYEERLQKAYYNVWEDLPSKGGWIIEHVEACSPELVEIFRPEWAILVDTGEQKIRLTAEARNKVGKDDPTREKRALETMKKSKKQFEALKGPTANGVGSPYILKKLEA
jgi:hypothetical protein